jgi:hypothetical protein
VALADELTWFGQNHDERNQLHHGDWVLLPGISYGLV